jgi:hypothetical protein
MHASRRVGLCEATVAPLGNEWIGFGSHEIEAKANCILVLIQLSLVGG